MEVVKMRSELIGKVTRGYMFARQKGECCSIGGSMRPTVAAILARALSGSPPLSRRGNQSDLINKFSTVDDAWPPLSLRCTVMENEPLARGVPWIAPVVGSRLNPVGSGPIDHRYGGTPPDARNVSE